MKEYLLVGVGGMVGSMTRYLSGSYFMAWFPAARFPWGTFFINVLGCLLIGIVAGLIERMTNFNAEIRLAVITGFLGGFTTFSAFGIETVSLMKNGFPFLGCTYAISSVVLGVGGVYLGLRLTI